jgi:hypothetical protein
MTLGPPTGTGSQEEKEEGTGTETTNVPDEWTSVHQVPRRRRPQRGRRRNHQTEEGPTSSVKIPSKPLKAGYGSSSVYQQTSSVFGVNNNNNNSDSIANEKIYNSLNICLRELKESEYWRNIKQLLLKMRPDDDDDRRYSNSNNNCKLFQSIVCYGIGNFGTTRSSAPLWQLALAVTIRDYIRTFHTHNDDDETSLGDDNHYLSSSLGSTLKSTSNKNNDDDHRRRLPTMYYFEPLMTVEESIVLEKLGINIISENERGGRSVIDEGGCLFFMPHCPMTLYTNLLHANWDCLRENNILIFGNSLSNYIDGGGNNNNNNIDIANNNNPQKRQALDILKGLQPHWEEERLDISKNDISDRPAYFERAFNDSSFTSFRRTINIAAASTTKTKTNCWPKRPQLLDSPQSDDGGEVL